GGDSSVESKFIPPIVVSGVKVSDPLMEDEIFGPIVGVKEVKDEDEAIRLIQSRDRPLSLYVSTNSPDIANKVLDNTISGFAIVIGYIANMFCR
ncbi:Aldehyde dehydrogenase, partial [Podochytrium sp. JEL0797]